MRPKELAEWFDIGSTFTLVICPNCDEAFLVLDDLPLRVCPYCVTDFKHYRDTLIKARGLDLEEGIFPEGEEL